MAFIETRFPTDIAYGSSGGPEYSTDVVIMHSGYEQRNSNWSQARVRYNVAPGVHTQTQLDALIAFFRARKGRADGFRFKDWTDFQAMAEIVGTGDDVETQFQLVKTYASGSTTETRIITKPVNGTVGIYFDDVLQSASLYSINYATGMVTFIAPPADGVEITADFEFDIPVRFDADRLSAVLDNYGSHSHADIPIIEIRV